jgi:hypothetical protein
MQTRNFLSYYATKFRTVEIDSTYYGTPSASTVMNNKVYDRYYGSLLSFHDPTSGGLANIKLFVGLTYSPTTSQTRTISSAGTIINTLPLGRQ